MSDIVRQNKRSVHTGQAVSDYVSIDNCVLNHLRGVVMQWKRLVRDELLLPSFHYRTIGAD